MKEMQRVISPEPVERFDRVTWIVVGFVFVLATVRGVIPALVGGERVGLALLALGAMLAMVVVPAIVLRVRQPGSRRR